VGTGCWVLMPPQLSSAMQGISRSWSTGPLNAEAPGVGSESACWSEVTDEATVAKVRSARRSIHEQLTLVAEIVCARLGVCQQSRYVSVNKVCLPVRC